MKIFKLKILIIKLNSLCTLQSILYDICFEISLFNNPMETFPGLTINDLNRYLPALRTIKDVEMDAQNMKEGMFLANCLDGLRKLPDNSIDLIIANPFNKEIERNPEFGNGNTLQSYYQWNQSWVEE